MKNYWLEQEPTQKEIRDEIVLNVSSEEISNKKRKLKAVWTKESAEDLESLMKLSVKDVRAARKLERMGYQSVEWKELPRTTLQLSRDVSASNEEMKKMAKENNWKKLSGVV